MANWYNRPLWSRMLLVFRDMVRVLSSTVGTAEILTVVLELNASMRRIDLFCKLVAPVVISLVDGLSTRLAVWVVLGVNASWVLVEYLAIHQVATLFLYTWASLTWTGVQSGSPVGTPPVWGQGHGER